MNKLFAVSAVLFAFALPSLAQGTHLSLSDQKRFDSYYSRWQSYKATNNQSEVRSMEGRMQDVYRHYGIPANTPYRNVASGGRGWGSPSASGYHDWDRNRDWDRDRHADRDHDRDRDDWDRDDRDHHDRGLHRGWYKHHHDDDDRDRDHDRREHHDHHGDHDRDHDRDHEHDR